jgi:hypothetical protein
LPMADAEAFAWFSSDGREASVKVGTFGRRTIDGKKNLFAWSAADTAYAAIAQVWKIALEEISQKTVLLRGQKSYPEMFEYLGWCSWENFGKDIDEQNMVRAVEQIEKSGIPIRYFLMDEGHADNATLRADAKKFPNGYRALTKYKKADKIRWFGVWWAFLGAAHGVKSPGELGSLSDAMMKTQSGVLIPKPDEINAGRFFDHILSETRDGGFDFIKVDFMVDALPLYAGVREEVPTLGGLPPDNSNSISNPYSAAAMLVRVCEQQVASKTHGMMNCNWHNAACVFNSGQSAVGRCSEDYKSNELDRAKLHLYHAFTAIPWLGQIAWGDHDMFHSTDRVAASEMAISKAISGGPIYLSDEPSTFAPQWIRPLCYEDGLLLRPMAPGTPVEEDIFYAPDNGRLLRITAPLQNHCAAVAIYHLESAEMPRTLSAEITPQHYTHVSAMMQSYPGPWSVPDEGLLVYDWNKKQAFVMHEKYDVTLSEFGVTLLQMSPIRSGWSVIGRSDKYLPGAAIEDVAFGQNQASFMLKESGPLLVWSSGGTPQFDGKPLQMLSEGLFLADLPIAVGRVNIHLHR